MAKADKIIKDLYKEILEEGELRPETRMFWKDGERAFFKSVVGKQLVFEPEDGVPFLTSKFVPKKSCLTEMFWIWFKRSNKVQDLRDLGSHVWDEWELPDGTIGKAYGYQLENKKFNIRLDTISDKSLEKIDFPSREILEKQMVNGCIPLNQVEYIVQQLIDNPYSRHLLTMLWNVEDYPEMSLPPCVYRTQWLMYKGRLDLIVGQRSADSFLGLPYNIAQYGVLHDIISELTGHEKGRMIFEIGDAHLYDRHFESAKAFILNEEHEAPKLTLENINNINDISFPDNVNLKEYKMNVGNSGKIFAEIAITESELKRLNEPNTNL